VGPPSYCLITVSREGSSYIIMCSQAVTVCSFSPSIYAQGECFLMRRNCNCNCKFQSYFSHFSSHFRHIYTYMYTHIHVVTHILTHTIRLDRCMVCCIPLCACIAHGSQALHACILHMHLSDAAVVVPVRMYVPALNCWWALITAPVLISIVCRTAAVHALT
jgi:hypothetical protein